MLRGKRKETPIPNLTSVPVSSLNDTVSDTLQELREHPLDEVHCVIPDGDSDLRDRLRFHLLKQDDPLLTPHGLRFQSARHLAADLLRWQGWTVHDLNRAQRLLGLEATIHADPNHVLDHLEYYRADQLQEGPGYAAALNGAMLECLDEGIDPDVLEDCPEQESTDQRLMDLARLWRSTRSIVSDAMLSKQEIVAGRELMTFLDQDVSVPDSMAPVIAILDDPSPLRKQFIDELRSKGTVRVIECRTPVDGSFHQTKHQSNDDSALVRLQSRLFELESYLELEDTDLDDSVRLERYSVPEREHEFAGHWLIRRLMDHEDRPDQLGLIVLNESRKGPLISQLRTLEQRLEHRSLPLDVPGGLSLSDVPRGPNLLVFIEALDHALRQDEMIALCPLLEVSESDGEDTYMSRREWRAMIYECGMIGGSRARPGDADRWLHDIDQKIDIYDEKLEQDPDEDDPRRSYSVGRVRRRRSHLEMVREPIEELVDLARAIYAEDDEKAISLERLWDRVKTFASEYLDMTSHEFDVMDVITDQVQEGFHSRAARHIKGSEAIRVLGERLRSTRINWPSFDEGGIFVGTLPEARFRSFNAVRLIGMSENTIQPPPREDPILPDHLRRIVREHSPENRGQLQTSVEKATEGRRQFYHLVQSVQDELICTTSLRDPDGIKRAFSSSFLDVSMGSGLTGPEVADDESIAQIMDEGRSDSRDRMLPLQPIRKRQLDDHRCVLPSRWDTDSNSPLNLKRARRLLDEWADPELLSPLDGRLPDWVPDEVIPGLTPDRAISASGLSRLVTSPHWFLLDKIFGWKEPPSAMPTMKLSPLHFGSLVHTVAERVYGEADEDERVGSPEFKQKAHNILGEEFEKAMREYTLLGEDTRRREKQRLKKTINDMVEEDDRRGMGGFRFDTECSFGLEEPVRCDEGLYLRGFIDRVEKNDVGEPTVNLTDLKTGSPKTDDEWLPETDIQLGVYARGWEQDKVSELSFLYPVHPWNYQRVFREDGSGLTLEGLMSASSRWIQWATSVLKSRTFPHTPDDDDYRFCSFDAIFRDDACDRSAETIRQGDWEPGEQLLALKEMADE